MTIKLTPEDAQKHNDAVQFYREVTADTDALRWSMSDYAHPAIYRALKIDKGDPSAFYAAAMCRLMRVDGKAMIGIAWPAPRVIPDGEIELFYPHLFIKNVVYWNPIDNMVLPTPNGWETWFCDSDLQKDQGVIYANPFVWLRDWASARAQWFVHYKSAMQEKWSAIPEERDLCPGMILTDAPANVSWPSWEMPRDLTVIGANPKEINKAILRSAHLPITRSANHRIVA
jgi:hypothetical protein